MLYPDLLGTYGDGGNALALAYRARARGVSVEIVPCHAGDALPAADIYLLGGGEDGPQQLATDLLRRTDLARRVEDGATVLAVCAGLQLLGTSFSVAGVDDVEGLGIVPIVTTRGDFRCVGDLAVAVGDNVLVGFENHGGRTLIGDLPPIGVVRLGTGNDGRVDGFRYKNLVATYAHGPVAALNPWFADEILERALLRSLEPLATVADRLHRERVRVLTVR